MKNLLIIVFSLVFIFTCKSDKNIKRELKHKIEFIKLEKAVLAGGNLFRVDSFPSNFITPRPVDVWLPEGYSKDKKYNVIY